MQGFYFVFYHFTYLIVTIIIFMPNIRLRYALSYRKSIIILRSWKIEQF